MFGKRLDYLKKSASIPETIGMVEHCHQFNRLRNKIAHKLVQSSSLEEIRQECTGIQEEFNIIYDNFELAHDQFRLAFKDYKKDKEFS